jgi:putative FmdB family regulatory protein
MPTYTYICEECETVRVEMRTIAKRDDPSEEPCEGCKGELVRIFDAPFVTARGLIKGTKKGREGFNDVLNQIHGRAAGSELDKTSTEMR